MKVELHPASSSSLQPGGEIVQLVVLSSSTPDKPWQFKYRISFHLSESTATDPSITLEGIFRDFPGRQP
jgi:hypothetical protein